MTEIGTALVGVLGVLLTVLTAMVGHLYKRLHEMRSELDKLWGARENAWENRVVLDNHIDTLEDHIRSGKPPPPPTRPKLT